MARICVVRQSFVPDDPRVRREIHALAEAGHCVDVICMRRPGEPPRETYRRMRIHRLPITHRRAGIGRYIFEYVLFPVIAAIYLALLDWRRRFELVQVNTVPDWLAFAAIGPRLRGVPLLLDLHEVMPEFFASKFRTRLDHPLVRVLGALEQASIRFCSFAITCTEQMKGAFVQRGAASKRMAVVMNSAEECTFNPARFPPRSRRDGRFSLISYGTIEERYGLDTIVRAVDQLRDVIPGLRLEIYGEGSYINNILSLVRELGLQNEVRFHGLVPIDELIAAIADADAGVVAMKRDVFRELTHCNKMFELITMRRPVICSRTESVMAYFPDGSLKYFDADDYLDLARAIEELYRDRSLSDQLVLSAEAQNKSYGWQQQRKLYMNVVARLLHDGG